MHSSRVLSYLIVGKDMDNAKHIHHYVPRRYLRSWSRNGDGVIAVKFGLRNAARLVSVDSVGFEDNGYSYKQLNPEILRSVLCCRPRSKSVTDSMMRGFFLPTVVVPVFYQTLEDPANNDVITMWRMIQEAQLIDEAGRAKLELLRRVYYSNREQFGIAMQRHQKEGYEGILCNIEKKAWPILDSMLKGKLGWIRNKKLAFRMLYYICSQRTRSPSFKLLMSQSYKSIGVNTDFAAGGLYRRHILALDSAAILMAKLPEFTFRILCAPDGAEFITGDLPVVRIRTDNSKDYYFPLSPKRALIFGTRTSFDRRNASLLRNDASSVFELNQAIRRDSTFQIYGTCEHLLDELSGCAKAAG